MTLKIYIQSSENPCCRPRSKHFPQRQKNSKNLVDQLSYLKQHWRTHLFSPDHLFFQLNLQYHRPLINFPCSHITLISNSHPTGSPLNHHENVRFFPNVAVAQVRGKSTTSFRGHGSLYYMLGAPRFLAKTWDWSCSKRHFFHQIFGAGDGKKHPVDICGFVGFFNKYGLMNRWMFWVFIYFFRDQSTVLDFGVVLNCN